MYLFFCPLNRGAQAGLAIAARISQVTNRLIRRRTVTPVHRPNMYSVEELVLLLVAFQLCVAFDNGLE